MTPGTKLGLYEIVALLGAGGMGEVYRAKDTKLGREVALKILPASFTNDPERVARFRREAQVLASLNHPHIAQIYGLEESNGTQFLVLELVDGESLEKRIARGAIPIDEALPIAKEIAEALEAAHEKGIVHRDLKPANIALTNNGQVKVLDFGLAKAVEPSNASINLSVSPTITSPALMTGVGVILGTAAYMAPEQAKGRAADKRSDIWAFGCVLYEMLTGRRVFEGDDVSDTLAAVLRGEPDWAALPPSVPNAIRALIEGCLVKDQRQRVGDISVTRFIFADPTRLVASSGASTAGDSLSRSARLRAAIPIGAAMLLAAALVAIGAWRMQPRQPPAPVARFALALPEGQIFPLASRRGISLSPDGHEISYVAPPRLFVWSLSDFEPHAIPGGEAASNPRFSPDGRSIAFFRDDAIKRIAVTGGAAVTVCLAESPFGMSWDSSGIVFGQGRQGIFRCSADGGTPEQLATVENDEEAEAGQIIAGGSALLFAVARTADGNSRWDKARVVVQTLSSGARKTLVNNGTDPSYLPTGHLLYSQGGVVFAVRFDPVRQTISGGPVPVLEGVRHTPGAASTGGVQFATSETGTVAYIPGPIGTAGVDRAIALADRAGAVTRLSPPPGPYTYVRASPNGARLAVGTDDGKEAIIWMCDFPPTTAMRRLTLTGRNRFPIWAPDGQHVAYQSDREGDLALFVQRADGTGTIERLTRPAKGEAQVPESWSPDGTHILFSSAKDSIFTLWSLSVGDKQTVPFGDLQSGELFGSTFSPDGRWVAYASTPGKAGYTPARSPNRGVYIQPFPPTGERYQVPKVERDFHPAWDPKGRELFYVPTASQLAVVSFTTKPTVTFGSPVQLPVRVTGNQLSIDLRAFDVLPDGRFVGLLAPSGADGVGSLTNQIRLVQHFDEELKRLVPAK